MDQLVLKEGSPPGAWAPPSSTSRRKRKPLEFSADMPAGGTACFLSHAGTGNRMALPAGILNGWAVWGRGAGSGETAYDAVARATSAN